MGGLAMELNICHLYPDLLNVYGIRREFNSYNVPTIIVYIWSAAGNILPLLLIYYFVKGKKGMVAFLIFIIILNFSINGLREDNGIRASTTSMTTSTKSKISIIWFFALFMWPGYH